MSKAHRGTGIRNEANHGRATCPKCGKEGVKVLYETELDGQKVKICKRCNATLKNIAKKQAKIGKAEAAKAAAEAAAAEATSAAATESAEATESATAETPAEA